MSEILDLSKLRKGDPAKYAHWGCEYVEQMANVVEKEGDKPEEMRVWSCLVVDLNTGEKYASSDRLIEFNAVRNWAVSVMVNQAFRDEIKNKNLRRN